jgi:hypothetical protein
MYNKGKSFSPSELGLWTVGPVVSERWDRKGSWSILGIKISFRCPSFLHVAANLPLIS